MHTVIETSVFTAHAKGAGLTEADRYALIDMLADNPKAGALIPGTGGARKVRFAERGKGKSGGYRIITFYAAEDVPLFLLDIFAKGDKVNLTMTERNALAKILGGLAEAYRASTKAEARKKKGVEL